MSDRPYDFRWGSPQEVNEVFHIPPTTLKAGWKAGWIKARQPAWVDDEHRSQTVYCFEDIHHFMEDVLHELTENYTKRFWTTAELANTAQVMPKGPYGKK